MNRAKDFPQDMILESVHIRKVIIARLEELNMEIRAFCIAAYLNHHRFIRYLNMEEHRISQRELSSALYLLGITLKISTETENGGAKERLQDWEKLNRYYLKKDKQKRKDILGVEGLLTKAELKLLHKKFTDDQRKKREAKRSAQANARKSKAADR